MSGQLVNSGENRSAPAPNRGKILSMRARPRCSDCGNDVLFHRTASGKFIMLEPGAWEDGNVIIERGVAVVLGRNDPRRFDGRILLMPHAAKCSARATRAKRTA